MEFGVHLLRAVVFSVVGAVNWLFTGEWPGLIRIWRETR